ncbi:unnamed protein product [Gongylonema pulchrum]|uniref:DNA replication complex GINS protein PSF3 n=1 Tax=Gongylonema pulchrum TaxID=637853 RepID=A0A183E066_9BILA|nr:unnamed protein product [Gongylonema pulchrum]
MEKRKSMCVIVDKDYYNLKDILACRQILKCLFPAPLGEEVFNLIGQREPEMEDGICYADLPLFMVKSLPNRKVLPPVQFGKMQMEILRASPEHVDIMRLNQFYYIVARHLARLLTGERAQFLAETVLYTFLQRSGWIIKFAIFEGPKSKKLDCMEAELYDKALKSSTQFSEWFFSKQALARKKLAIQKWQ